MFRPRRLRAARAAHEEEDAHGGDQDHVQVVLTMHPHRALRLDPSMPPDRAAPFRSQEALRESPAHVTGAPWVPPLGDTAKGR